MTESELRDIESALSVRLPDVYRRVMSSEDARSCDEFWFGGLFNRAKDVVQQTVFLRGVAESCGLPWPSAWIVVSEINGADPLIIDTATDGSMLKMCNHETNEVEPEFDSLVRFVDSVRADEGKAGS